MRRKLLVGGIVIASMAALTVAGVAAMSRSDCARGKLTIPENDRWNPRSSAARARVSSPVKQ